MNQSHYFNDGKVRSMLVPAGPDHAQVAATAGIAEYLDAVYAHHFTEDVELLQNGVARLHDLFQMQEKKLLAPLLRLASWP